LQAIQDSSNTINYGTARYTWVQKILLCYIASYTRIKKKVAVLYLELTEELTAPSGSRTGRVISWQNSFSDNAIGRISQSPAELHIIRFC